MKKWVESGTKHSVERMEQRLRIKSSNRMTRQIKLAKERGFGSDSEENVPKKLLKYIISIETKGDNSAKVKVYNNAVYVFGSDDDVLVTVWKLGKELSVAYECAMKKKNKKTNTEVEA